jgi:hypothetical protein
MVSVDSSDTKGNLLRQVAATAASIALIKGRQNRSPNTVLPLNPSDFMDLLEQQKRMGQLRENYGEPDAAYLNACFGKTNTH